MAYLFQLWFQVFHGCGFVAGPGAESWNIIRREQIKMMYDSTKKKNNYNKLQNYQLYKSLGNSSTHPTLSNAITPLSFAYISAFLLTGIITTVNKLCLFVSHSKIRVTCGYLLHPPPLPICSIPACHASPPCLIPHISLVLGGFARRPVTSLSISRLTVAPRGNQSRCLGAAAGERLGNTGPQWSVFINTVSMSEDAMLAAAVVVAAAVISLVEVRPLIGRGSDLKRTWIGHS